MAAGQAHASASRQALETEADELRTQIDDLRRRPVALPPAPKLWRRRERSEVDGAAFWKLVNPRDGQDPMKLARLEAALAASGLLDAWISHDTSALDTFAVADRARAEGRPNLGDVLDVAPEADQLAERVRLVLNSVTLHAPGEPLPTDGIALSFDGRWRVAELTGRAAPCHNQAEWLGEAAREAQRQRRLAELKAQFTEVCVRIDDAKEAEQRWTNELAQLNKTFAAAPSDDPLRQALTQYQASDEVARAQQKRADAAIEAARQERVAADGKRAELRQAGRTHQLPIEEERLHEVSKAVDTTRSELRRWHDFRADREQATRRWQEASDETARSETEVSEQQAALARDEHAHRVAAAKVDALRAAINSDDKQILDELTRLEREASDAEDERERLDAHRSNIAARLGRAKQQLANVERRREEATQGRAEAHRALRELIDGGLAEGLDVTISEPTSALVEHVRTQAAELRRGLRPRGWNDGSQGEAPKVNASIVERLRRNIDNSARDIRAILEQSGRSITVLPTEPIPQIEVLVNSNGLTLPLSEAGDFLRNVCTELEGRYSTSVRQTLDRLLGSTFLEHMRERIGQAGKLVADINDVLQAHPTGTDGTTLRIRLEPGSNKAILDTISGPSLIDPEVASQVRAFLKEKVDEAKRSAIDQGKSDWHDSLAAHLDYRTWYEVALESRVSDGRWGPLTTRRYAELSGGARAVMLMLPLVAALAAQYQHLPTAPRPLWLDEAFDGLDVANRSMVLSLLQRFDLDVLLAGPGRLVNVDIVPAAAIYQVVRAQAPEPGADLIAELWSGRTLQAIDLPLSWLDEPPAAPDSQESLL
ncbi:MAG: SbcC/MukB-like Walker B domain-containing protein [Propionibacteriaceae bacterium]|nr:SbcC/MukB-like Walker B domain-containing protein [Propionibacteriaceae bacterium]